MISPLDVHHGRGTNDSDGQPKQPADGVATPVAAGPTGAVGAAGGGGATQPLASPSPSPPPHGDVTHGVTQDCGPGGAADQKERLGAGHSTPSRDADMDAGVAALQRLASSRDSGSAPEAPGPAAATGGTPAETRTTNSVPVSVSSSSLPFLPAKNTANTADNGPNGPSPEDIQGRPFACEWPGCTKRFRTGPNRKKHQRVHTGGRPFACEWEGCTYKATVQGNLDVHRRVHTGERPYKCTWNGCKYSATTSSLLKRHTRTHTGEKPFVCEWENCKFRALTSTNLKQHTRTHTGEKPFLCDWPNCGVRFRTSSQFKKHMRVHIPAGEKHPCSWPKCKYRTAELSTLEDHMRSHTGEKPFACKVEGCEFRARSAHLLSKHDRQVHTKSKTFHCSWSGCNFSAFQTSSVQTHVRVHTGERPFACTFKGCAYRADQSANLARHAKAHIPQKELACAVDGCSFVTTSGTLFTAHAHTHVGGSSSSSLSLSSSAVATRDVGKKSLKRRAKPARQVDDAPRTVVEYEAKAEAEAMEVDTRPEEAMPLQPRASPASVRMAGLQPNFPTAAASVSDYADYPNFQNVHGMQMAFSCKWGGCHYQAPTEEMLQHHAYYTHFSAGAALGAVGQPDAGRMAAAAAAAVAHCGNVNGMLAAALMPPVSSGMSSMPMPPVSAGMMGMGLGMVGAGYNPLLHGHGLAGNGLVSNPNMWAVQPNNFIMPMAQMPTTSSYQMLGGGLAAMNGGAGLPSHLGPVPVPGLGRNGMVHSFLLN